MTAVLVAVCRITFDALRTEARAKAAIVALGALVGVAMISALLVVQSHSHGADRRALELRAQELTARTLAPGSALACLDAVAGENVDAACESAVRFRRSSGRCHVLYRGAV